MKTFVVDQYKKKGALRLADMPEPDLQEDDVLVQIHAASVNPLDFKIRDGQFKALLPYHTPFILGHDVAGTVVRVGSSVKRFKAGDEVYARPRDHRIGTFAEFIAINEADVALKPGNLSMVEAASIPLVGLTAWQALVEVGNVKRGQKVFMNYVRALLCGMLIAPTALSGSGFAANRPQPGKTVTTRFGLLEFTVPFADGYPTPATVDKLYAELDFQRATQAYLWSLPMVGFAQWQHEHRAVFGTGNGDVVSYRSFDDKLGLITANATTPYLIAFADLGREGPMVLEVPAQGLTGSVLDYWQRPVDAPAINLVGKFLLLGPEQRDPKDPSLTVIHIATNNVFFGFRALGTDENELKAALEGLKIYPYARRSAPPAIRILSPEGRKWSGTQPRGLDYWRRLKEAIDSEPVAERDRLFMGMLKSIGIEKGKPFEPTPAQRQILEEATLAGEAMAKANTFDKRIATPFWPGSHWKLAMHLEPSQRAENYDQLDERAAWFYEAVTASENMTGRHVGVGSTYLGAYRDSKGAWLDGGRFYRLRVPANAPAKNFWSVTVYDVNTRCFIDTQWKIADRSSRQDLTKNPDGSVDLYIGPRPPGDPARRRNWIPSVAGKAWFTYLRLYGPLQGYFDKTWVAPDIEAMRAWE